MLVLEELSWTEVNIMQNDSLGEFKDNFEPIPIAVQCNKDSLSTGYNMLTTSTQMVESMTYDPNDYECKECGYKTRCEVALVKYQRKHLTNRRKTNE